MRLVFVCISCRLCSIPTRKRKMSDNQQVSLRATKESEFNELLERLEHLLHEISPPEELFRSTYHTICDLRVQLFLCVHDGTFVS